MADSPQDLQASKVPFGYQDKGRDGKLQRQDHVGMGSKGAVKDFLEQEVFGRIDEMRKLVRDGKQHTLSVNDVSISINSAVKDFDDKKLAPQHNHEVFELQTKDADGNIRSVPFDLSTAIKTLKSSQDGAAILPDNYDLAKPHEAASALVILATPVVDAPQARQGGKKK